MRKVKVKKCCKCGKRIHGGYAHTIYCPHCARFAIRMATKKFSPEIVKQLWDYVAQYGYTCHYTRMELDMDDPHSPWYCVFDHWHPRDPKKIVLTSSLVNEMKANLTEDEFWYIIRQLAHHRRHHTQVRKIRLSCWPGHVMPKDEADRVSQALGLSKTPNKNHRCDLCGKRALAYNAKYCPRCAKFVARLHSKQLPPETIEETLEYVRQNGFTCFYSRIQLDLDDPKSPWYCVLDHWIPQDPGRIVLTCDLFNVMKSDLSEKEFWYYVLQLADYIEKGKPVRKRKLVYWWRLYPVEDV